jgi:hypothetical protein
MLDGFHFWRMVVDVPYGHSPSLKNREEIFHHMYACSDTLSDV